KVGVPGVMHHARLVVRAPHAHERFAAAVHELRYRPAGVIADDGDVLALVIHRPRVHVSEPVAGREPHWVHDTRIVLDLHGRVVPIVVTPPQIAPVIQGHLLLEHGGTGPQYELHHPLHAI